MSLNLYKDYETCKHSSIIKKTVGRNEPIEAICCDLVLGLQCYHGNNRHHEKFKHWEPIIELKDFISKKEMTL